MAAQDDVIDSAATFIEVAPLMQVSPKNAELELGGPRGQSRCINAEGYFWSARSSSYLFLTSFSPYVRSRRRTMKCPRAMS